MANIILISKVSLCLLCLAILAREVSAAAVPKAKAKVRDRFENPEDQKTCKKDSRRALKSIVKDFGVCNSAMKKNTNSTEEHTSKMGCVIRCVMDSQKILTRNGLVTNETIVVATANKTVLAMDPLHDVFYDCKVKFGEDLDPNDPLCVKYGPFGYCIQTSIADICEVPV